METKDLYPHLSKPWMQYYDPKKINTKDPQTNLADYVLGKNRNNMAGIASSYYKNEMTYQEMFERIHEYAKMLASVGVTKGSRVFYLVPNIPESGLLWLASSRIGAISDFVDPRPDSMDLVANAKKILEIIKFEGADYIIALDKCYVAMLKPIENELKDLGIKQIITISATDSMNLAGKIDYLKDVLAYNSLRNVRVDEKVKKLKGYEAMLAKIKAMKNTIARWINRMYLIFMIHKSF